ncbi:MAG: RNA methyltransferase [Anaerolineae bacterium]|nr:RNA methyltransferase [Anaerolineae bacterium]
MANIPITSTQNNKVKLAFKLRFKRSREQSQRFVIEYYRDLERAIEQGYQLDYAFFCEELASEGDWYIMRMLDPHLIHPVTEQVMVKTSYRQNPGGLLAVMVAPPLPHISQLDPAYAGSVLALVNLQIPGNIGALLRTADATGFMTVMVDTSLDLYNPNIIRSSTGTCFLNTIYAANSRDAIDYFKQNRYQVFASHLDGATSLFDINLADRSAIIMGTEDTGLDEFWVQQCDSLVKIPMIGQVADSLNVSVSGAIFMYEALRQRLQSS